MIDKDVHLDMDIRVPAVRKPVGMGRQARLTRPRRQPGDRFILGALPTGEPVGRGERHRGGLTDRGGNEAPEDVAEEPVKNGP